MTRQLTTTFLLMFALAAQLRADVRGETLRAINWVENPTNHTRIGRFGELGPYQFRPATWRMHTKKPFQLAAQREAADEIAVKHYEWIRRSLKDAGVDASPFNIALAWNSGVDNVVKGRAPDQSYNYAERVVNLVQAFRRQRPASVASSAAILPGAEMVPAVPVQPSLDRPGFVLALAPEAPRFALAPAAAPVPEPVVHTSHEPAPEKPLLVFSTTATLTPRFSLMPSLLD